jgi:hypothetical protein
MRPFLFPNRFKRIGWLLTILFLGVGLAFMIYGLEMSIPLLELTVPKWLFPFADGILGGNKDKAFITMNFTDEFITIALTIGLLLVAFSKEKIEDEFIAQTRLESLQWGVWLNAILLIVGTLVFYDEHYFSVMIFNMFTPLIFFVIRFSYIIYLKPRLEKTSERSTV